MMVVLDGTIYFDHLCRILEDFGPKSAKVPENHGDFNTRGSLADLDPKFIFHHLAFDWALL
jgi:hypothetical protein